MSYDYRILDDVIHSRVRLAIMSFLASAQHADFNELKRVLKVSDGNLSTHLRKLEDSGYVHIEKSFQGRKPLTTVEITKAGKDAFKAYLASLTNMLDASIET